MSVFSFIFGKTIFEVVKESNFQGMCAILDKHPERVNSVDSEGYTPLHRALMARNNEMAAELINRGAVIPVQNEGGPIHWALDSDKIHLLLPVINREKDINTLDKNGIVPVAKAAAKGYNSAVERLIERNADLEAVTEKGFTALHLALRQGHPDTARILIRTGRALNGQDYRGRTALMVAVKEKYGDVIDDLLKKKVDVNLADENGWRALHKATTENHLDWMRALIDAGAELNAQDENGWTALHLACWKGHPEAAAMLIIRGADRNSTTKDGNTPLMWTLRGQSSSHRAIIDRLLIEGVDVTLANQDGFTALHKASQAGYAKIIVKLMENGANAMVLDNEGRTAIDVAKDDTIRDLLSNLQSKYDLLKEREEEA